MSAGEHFVHVIVLHLPFFFLMRCSNSIIGHRFQIESTSSTRKNLHNWCFSRVLYSSLISSLVHRTRVYGLHAQQKDLVVYKNQSISRSLSNLILFLFIIQFSLHSVILHYHAYSSRRAAFRRFNLNTL